MKFSSNRRRNSNSLRFRSKVVDVGLKGQNLRSEVLFLLELNLFFSSRFYLS